MRGKFPAFFAVDATSSRAISGRFAFLINELDATLAAYAFDPDDGSSTGQPAS